jgi:hypothetical protein
MPEPTIILSIETPDGVFLRRIMPASLLPTNVEHGGAAEDATRDAAAFWGLPDFVFRSALRVRGSGIRELGDAIVVVGDRAASVQVKARQAPSKDESKERSWLDKKIREGARQAAGTIRALHATHATSLVNERGRTIAIEPAGKTWLGVVVVDHPGVAGYVPAAGVLALLRRDWEFLFGQLKSTYAVLEYLHRVAREPPIVLGEEPVRYYEFAAADAAAPRGKIDPRLTALLTDSKSVPLLPQAPAGQGQDQLYDVVRLVLEDVATTGSADEVARLEALAALDSLPVAYRAELGRDILRWMHEVGTVPDPGHAWRFRTLFWPDRPYLLFGAATRFSPTIQSVFGDYVSLRHQQKLELMPEGAQMLSVGVLLTPRHDGHRPWDTTMAATRGDQGLDAKSRRALELLWGPLGATAWKVDRKRVKEAFEAANRAP